MYIRPAHAELNLEVLHKFIQQHALGTFTTHLPHPTIAPLQSTHIPFLIDPPTGGISASSDGEGKPIPGKPLGRLRGHMARANPQTRAILDTVASSSAAVGSASGASSYLPSFLRSGTTDPSVQANAAGSSGTLPEEVLIIFQSPIHSYTTPKFYTSTKPDTGKVVPTWDYAAVQVYGKVKVYDKGEEAGRFLQQQVEDLSEAQERMHAEKKAKVTGCPLEGSWKVGDAPEAYVELLKKGIIGLEIEITRIEGRFKLSQEMGDGDWQGVVDGFKGIGEDGQRLAQMIEERGQTRVSRKGKEEWTGAQA